MLYRVEGIVIRRADYGEGHAIITLFTKEAGKVSVMARGAKKMKSRHSAVTQLFTYGEYVYFKNGQMGTLNSGEIIHAHHGLREDLFLSAYSAYLVELTDRMIGEHEGGSFLFEQLKAGLEAIEAGKDPAVITHIFELKMLGLAGYAPELHHCVSCGRDGGAASISVSMGGILCENCRLKDPAAHSLSVGMHKLLILFQQIDLRRLGAIDLKEQSKEQLKNWMREYMDTYTGVQWRARHFLDQMEKHKF